MDELGGKISDQMHWLADPISIYRNLIAGVEGADVKAIPPSFRNDHWGDDRYTFADS